MLMNETIEKYIEYTMNSGNSHIRAELEWLINGLDNPKETEEGIKEVADHQES